MTDKLCTTCRKSRGRCNGGHYRWNKERRRHEHYCDGYRVSLFRMIAKWARTQLSRVLPVEEER